MTLSIPWLNDLLVADSRATKALLFYALAVIAPWLSRRTLYWNAFLLVALLFAFSVDRLSIVGLGIALGAAFVAYGFYGSVRPWIRWSCGVALLAMSLGLFFHAFPGFSNWKVVDDIRVSPLSTPLTLYFNFDKPLVGILIVGFAGLAARPGAALKGAAIGSMAGFVGGLMVLGLFQAMDFLRWDPKWPAIGGLWAFRNLLFTVIAEEALCRGFVQRLWHETYPRSEIAGVLVSGIFFGLLHFGGGWAYVVASALAGLIYAEIFRRTRSIEAAIFCHFVLNLVHFSLYSYPRLSP